MSQHTQEPWSLMDGVDTNVLNNSGLRVARCDFDGDMESQEAKANARRIVACVNRLAPFKTEQIEDFGYDLLGEYKPHIDELMHKITVVTQQRDDLLVAAKLAFDWLVSTGADGSPMPVLCEAIAIAESTK